MTTEYGIVIDASVLVARVRPSESSHTEVVAVMKALVLRNRDLYIPTIALAEVAAALSRSGTKASEALEAVQELGRLPGLRVVGVDNLLGELAYNIAASQRIRGCDAVYVALSLTLNATLITLDRQQRERSLQVVTAQTPSEVLFHLS